jgi:biuret amidohydrolase
MKTAFIGLDYIVDITCIDGKIAHSAKQVIERDVISHANQAIALARSKGWLIIQVKVGFSPSYVEQPKQSPLFGQVQALNALNLTQPGTHFHPQLDVRAGDAIVIKHRVSPFYATSLEAILRANSIEQLVVAGVSSALAVQSTVREAHDRDYQVLILEAACAATSAEEHKNAMHLLTRIARLVSVDELKLLP